MADALECCSGRQQIPFGVLGVPAGVHHAEVVQ